MTKNNLLFDLTGCTALVTGSSQGLGLAIARGLAEAGAAIVLNGRDEKKLAAAADTLRVELAGGRVATAVFDVTDGAAVMREIERVENDFGPIDILVNNAGIQQRAPLAEMTETQWRAVIDTNLTAYFLFRAPSRPG